MSDSAQDKWLAAILEFLRIAEGHGGEVPIALWQQHDLTWDQWGEIVELIESAGLKLIFKGEPEEDRTVYLVCGSEDPGPEYAGQFLEGVCDDCHSNRIYYGVHTPERAIKLCGTCSQRRLSDGEPTMH